MNKFNALMDDLRDSLIISVDNKGLFVPALVKIGINFVFYIIIFSIFFAMIIGGVLFAAMSAENYNANPMIGFLAGVGILALLSFLALGIINLIMSVGSTYLTKKALDGARPTKKLFFEGVKKHFWSIFGTNVMLIVIYILLSVFIVVAMIIYMFVGGLLTGGVALIIMPYLLYPILGTWITVAIDRDIGGLDGLKQGISIGKKNYLILLLLFFLWGTFVAYVASTGGLIAIALVPIASVILPVYFSVVMMLNLRRYYIDDQLSTANF